MWPACYYKKMNLPTPLGFLNPWEITDEIFIIKKTDSEGLRSIHTYNNKNRKNFAASCIILVRKVYFFFFPYDIRTSWLIIK